MHRKTFLASVVAAALAVAFGAAPGHATGKPGKQGAGAERPVAADVAAAKTSRAVSPAASLAASTIQSRIADFVRTHGTKYTFGSYADPASGKAILETDAPSAVVSSLVDTFGRMIEVRRETISNTFGRGRGDDTPPYWGGAALTLAGTIPRARCSSGYTVQNPASTRFMVTAGRCFSNGQTVVTPRGRLVGTVRGNGLPSQDMALIGGQSYGPFIYVGGVTSATGAHIASAANPVVGFHNYCHSGPGTGEHCGHTVTSVSAQVCTPSGCMAPLIAFTGGTLPLPRDSGSPFYANSVSAPDKHIRGHIIGIRSSTTGYAEGFSVVAAIFGVSIVT